MDLAKELIFAVKKNNSHSGYGLQKECEALVGHVLKNMVKSNLPKLVADVKNENDAIKFREEGNQCFVTGDDDDAIEKYSMSLAYSADDASKALALANRSAALYRKQLHLECLIDVDAALAHGYPEEKKRKLQERAEKAVDALRQLFQLKDQNMNDLPSGKDGGGEAAGRPAGDGEGDGDRSSFSLVKEFLEEKLEDGKRLDGSVRASVDELMAKKPDIPPRYLIDEKELSLAHGPSDESPALSKGVRIAYSEKYGRHLLATEPFKPGDVVAIEDPFAYVIYKEKGYKHCHHCLSRSHNLIPCPKCPIALYCSEKCKAAAWQMAHRIECSVLAVLSKLLNVDVDKTKILTKIIRLLIVATKNGTEIDELRKDAQVAEKNPDNRTAGFTDQGILDSRSARSALSLATNLTARPLTEISAFACISALAVILLAMESTFFGRKFKPGQLKNIVERDDVRFCGAVVFRSCVVVSSNSFSVQLVPACKVGSGLYVSHSLMNHSCAPNTFRHFDGLTMITRALEPVKPGDQIFTCYGGGYQYMARPERRRKMMQDYFFDCDCVACADGWPTYSEILRDHVGSIAKTNKRLVEQLKPYRRRLLENKYDIDAVKSVLDILYAEVKMPCEEIVHAIQYLKSYYLDP